MIMMVNVSITPFFCNFKRLNILINTINNTFFIFNKGLTKITTMATYIQTI